MTSVAPSARGSAEPREGGQGRHRMEQAVEHLEGGIRNGLYLPGQRVVETEVAANSGLGVGPVRALADGSITDLLRAVTHYYFVLHDIAGNHYLTVLIRRLHLGLAHREVANLHPTIDGPRVVRAYVEATDALLAGDADRAIDLKMVCFDNYIEAIHKAGRTSAG